MKKHQRAAGASSSGSLHTLSSGGGGRGGGGGACMSDLPDPLLSLVFERAAPGSRARIALVCRRWHRVLYETAAIWREFDLRAPIDVLESEEWAVEEQEEWLRAKLRLLRRVSPLVEAVAVEDTAGVDAVSDVLQCLAASQLTRLETIDHEQPLTVAAVRALANLTRLVELDLSHSESALPSNSSWGLSQLTALTSLQLSYQQFPAGCSTALARLSLLRTLSLYSALMCSG